MSARQHLSVRAEQWPLKEPFIISRLVQEQGDVVVVEIECGGAIGRGECERSDWYDPKRRPVIEEIEALRPAIEAGLARTDLMSLLPSGPARNAIDCALWDLEAKLRGEPVWALAGLEQPLEPVTTVFTISLDSPEKMAAAARANRDRPILKLKLGRPGDPERVAAVREAAPNARLSVDANTGWSKEQLRGYLPELEKYGVELVEQPFPPGQDEALADVEHLIPIAADESCLDRGSLPGLAGRYDIVNIKLDKTGGLTEALALAREAKACGFGVMVGCNIGTSLAMAPAMLVAQLASFVDLDGPLLLARDREPGLRYEDSLIHPPSPELWG
jgi:L-alanine-DL-glutamate epimerase-like enolase superfamily enzyme